MLRKESVVVYTVSCPLSYPFQHRLARVLMTNRRQLGCQQMHSFLRVDLAILKHTRPKPQNQFGIHTTKGTVIIATYMYKDLIYLIYFVVCFSSILNFARSIQKRCDLHVWDTEQRNNNNHCFSQCDWLFMLLFCSVLFSLSELSQVHTPNCTQLH